MCFSCFLVGKQDFSASAEPTKLKIPKSGVSHPEFASGEGSNLLQIFNHQTAWSVLRIFYRILISKKKGFLISTVANACHEISFVKIFHFVPDERFRRYKRKFHSEIRFLKEVAYLKNHSSENYMDQANWARFRGYSGVKWANFCSTVQWLTLLGSTLIVIKRGFAVILFRKQFWTCNFRI